MWLALLAACATAYKAPVETFSGTLEARWWNLPPGYGESPEDPWTAALVLRLDEPRGTAEHVIYSPGDVTDVVPDAAAVACVGGRVTVRGRFTRVLWSEARGVIEDARVTSCTPAPLAEPAFGETIEMTGTFRRWWWYLAPGFGADPRNDKLAIGAVVLVDGRPVPLFPDLTVDGGERHRRFLAACDGQEVTVTGTWAPAKSPLASPPYKLVDVEYAGPCAAPSIPRAQDEPPKPMPPEWLQ